MCLCFYKSQKVTKKVYKLKKLDKLRLIIKEKCSVYGSVACRYSVSKSPVVDSYVLSLHIHARSLTHQVASRPASSIHGK